MEDCKSVHSIKTIKSSLLGGDTLNECEQVMGPFESRGLLPVEGASYYDQSMEDDSTEAFVGLNYTITALSSVNVAAETFYIALNLNLRYRIPDSDHGPYTAVMARGTLRDEEVQDMADNLEVSVKPPVLEVMNSKAAAFQGWRIISLARCLDTQRKWSWYVTFYCQLQAVCHEDFELRQFPFTKQALQVHIQCKRDMDQLAFVPFLEQSLQPIWQFDKEERRVTALPVRLNYLSCQAEMGTWDVENHHVAFPPLEYLAPLPSGKTYSRCIITIQCRQASAFFLWNTVPIVISLPVLAAMAVLEPMAQVADRLSIVFALLLTMSTYKISITSWMPKKRYLTYLDMYILIGFVCILLVGFLVALSGVVWYNDLEGSRRLAARDDGGDLGSDEGPSPWQQRERVLVIVIVAAWIATHIVLLCCWRRLYPTWSTVLTKEGNKMMNLTRRLQEGRENGHKMSDQRSEWKEPSPPPPPLPPSSHGLRWCSEDGDAEAGLGLLCDGASTTLC